MGDLKGTKLIFHQSMVVKLFIVVGREGRAVHKNELLVRIDDSELRAQLKAAEANIAISQQQEKQAALQINILHNQILAISIKCNSVIW